MRKKTKNRTFVLEKAKILYYNKFSRKYVRDNWRGIVVDYKKMIIEEIDKVKDEQILEYLFGLIETLIKRWG